MKRKFYISFFIFFTFIFQYSFCQNSTNGIDVTMNGYIINLGGKIFFQPCENRKIDFWESLDNTSFSLWYFREDLYLESIQNIGDSLLIKWYDNDDKSYYKSTLKYFYCTLEVNMMFLDSTFQNFKSPKLKLFINNKEYPLEGFYVDNRIKRIMPVDRINARRIYNYYKSKGYNIPNWLIKYIESFKSSKSKE